MNDIQEQHLQLVIEANKTTNITRIDSEEQGRILHIEDSLSALPEIDAAPAGLYADLGSGAGFPGIPIAIETGRETLLVESVGKKAALLDSFISSLQLDNVKVYPGRIEELSTEKRGCFSIVTARALSKLGSLMELSSPLLTKGGRLVCYKSHIQQDEYDKALSLCDKLGFKLASDREFHLSDGETYRRIVTFEKVNRAKLKLPRHVGWAQKKPL